MQAAVEDRRSILDRIRAGDSEGAAQASIAHADRIRTRWRQLYPEGSQN
jgi:DNA-binding FadR family transcriptional regulator